MYIYSRAMSSLIVSHDLHLMMLEIAVDNLFVPWTSEFDKVILKKTTVMFRMLDEEWTSLAPNRRDHRPYSGSSCESENFYGGRSVVFCVPAGFFEKKAIGVDVQLYVKKDVCKYFEMDSCQNVGFATVSVDDLVNGIAKQMRERNELSEHLSDFYKQQIISRSMTGTYNLLDENFRNTTATISLYIRISCLGKCLVTEITRVESDVRGAFCARREPDEQQYLSRQLTPDELQSCRWNARDLPRVPRGRLVCRCEELRKKDAAADLAERRRKGLPLVDADRLVTTAIADSVIAKAADIDAIVEPTAISVRKIDADAAAIKKQKARALKAKRRAIAKAKAKRGAIKDNERTFKKAFFLSKRGIGMATIGITERRMRIFPSIPACASSLKISPSSCQL
ncbi:uncharacterized protein [Anoplolepis gracilipes]|uniref:uncharacterized protein n=1 Tax=Anoplolepis gracilipes TaxID=354296 RepID=UPI003B9FFCCC